MLKAKILAASLLVSTFLITLSPTHAMDQPEDFEGTRIPVLHLSSGEYLKNHPTEPYRVAHLSVETLQKAYGAGLVEINGTTYRCFNNSHLMHSAGPDASPQFDHVYAKQLLLGSSDDSGWNHQEKRKINPKEISFNYSIGSFDESGSIVGIVDYINLILEDVSHNPVNDKPIASPPPQKADPSRQLPPAQPEIKFQIFQEPNQWEMEGVAPFITSYDAKRKLHFCMERLTAESAAWWKQRIGYEAYMLFGKITEQNKYMMAQAGNQQGGSVNDPFGVPIPEDYESDEEKFINMRGAQPIVDPDYKRLADAIMYYSPQHSLYQSAWRGFVHNLDSAFHIPTWVAYYSSEFIQEGAHKSIQLTSPAIKMAMTFQMGKYFYAPLGIYNSTIARAFDQEIGVEYTQLSMPFHIDVASSIRDTCPDVTCLAVRPLKTMAKIFASSGIPQDAFISYDCVQSNLSNFKIRDENAKKQYEIPNGHWLQTSPFLGGADIELIRAFPFSLYSVESLANHPS